MGLRGGALAAARAAVYIVALLFVALSFARLLHAPVAVVVVAGYSMYPTLKPGEIVVWCTAPHSCVIHRVVRVIDRRAVVTKGDANPVPDPPVPIRDVEYRAVYVIPRAVYGVPLLAALAYDAARVLRELARRAAGTAAGMPAARRLVLLGLAVYVTSLVAVPIVVPRPATPLGVLERLKPSASLVNASLTGDAATLYLKLTNTELRDVLACTASAGPASAPCAASATALGGGMYRVEAVPIGAQGFYLEAYLHDAKRLRVSITASLTVGRLYLRALIPLTWRPLHASFNPSNCTVTLSNPNPAPLRAVLEVRRAKLLPGPGYAVKPLPGEKLEVTVPPHGSRAVAVEPADLVTVVVRYPRPGGGEAVLRTGGRCGGGGG